ncbi:MAG: tetratricopeptide repeat protein, partial [Thermoguttaceae bacterium]|nr:tetratricopeptide repeat protein [Thermoguttaceae bacterium]
MRGIFPYSVRVTLFWGILVLAFWFIMPDRDGTWTAGALRAAEGDELLEKGIAAQNAGNWAEAISSLEQYIKNQPNSPRRNEAELYLGYSYLVRNNYVDPKDGATARSHFDYIIQQGVTAKYYREACVHYSHSLYCLMRYKEAEERFKKFIADFPNDDYLQYIYFYLGVCESHLGNPRESLNYFQTGITKFPQTPLLPSYKLEYAVSLGKDGRYAEADSQLAALASDPNYEFADKAALQRALLRLVQEDYNGAISMLDSFISAKKNDPKAQNMVAEAWQDKAYCYVLLNQNENALQAVEAIEKLPVEISPEIVLLKIRILCNLNRGMEATMLLTNLQGTAFGGNVPDVITYYQAMILLSQKRWDESITILNSLLKVTSTDQKFSVDYFEQPINDQQNRLLPFDFVDACGILILAYANRSVSTGNAVDKQTQANLFQIITQYAQQQKSNLLQKVVVKIGQKRDAVFQNQGTVATATPVTPGQISYSSLPIDNSISPNGNPGGAQGTPGGPPNNPGGPQNNPANPQNNPGGTPGVPAQPGTRTGEETAKITEENANAALKRANILYLNQEYERVNELLLELMTTSVSFWDDI